MTSRRSKIWWITTITAVVLLGVAGFLIVLNGGDDGAQARQEVLRRRSHGGGPGNRQFVTHPGPRRQSHGGGSGSRQMVTDRDAIYAAELVGPAEGWALTSSGLAWTTNGGGSWSNITPPGIAASSILAASFDRSGHGVVVSGRESNAMRVPLQLFRTTDDGRRWQMSTLEGQRPGSIGSVRASETDGRWWILVDEAGIDLAGTRLYESSDAGKTWKARMRPPASGQFTFLSQREGWIVGGEGSQLIYRTDDAGASWEVPVVPLPGPMEPGEEVPAQPGVVPTVPAESSKELPLPEEAVPLSGQGSNRRVVEYGLPERGPDGVLLPVTITTPAGRSEVLLYELSNGGAPKQISETKLARSAGESEDTTTFVAPDELLIQDQSSGSGPPALIIVSAGSGRSGSSQQSARTTRIGRASGLPEALPLHFFDRSHGTAVQDEICLLRRCSNHVGLFLTKDGGRNWSPSPARP